MPSPNIQDEDTFALVHSLAIAPVVATPDATYSANEQTAISDLVTAVNAIIVALKSAGIVAQD